MRRYIGYALGEVILIFAGITLALWFSNWNDESREREIELLALEDLVDNLRANEIHIKANIARDTDRLAACQRFMDATDKRESWNDQLGTDLDTCRWWTSPFLSFAAYESLKARGTDLVSNRSLRSEIVKLYEQDYAYLVNDTDKTFWGFQQNVIFPVFTRYVREDGGERSRPQKR